MLLAGGDPGQVQMVRVSHFLVLRHLQPVHFSLQDVYVDQSSSCLRHRSKTHPSHQESTLISHSSPYRERTGELPTEPACNRPENHGNTAPVPPKGRKRGKTYRPSSSWTCLPSARLLCVQPAPHGTVPKIERTLAAFQV